MKYSSITYITTIIIYSLVVLLDQFVESESWKSPVVSSSGLVCQDNPAVAESGYSCSFLARRFGGFLGCEKLLKDLSQDSLPAGIPGNTRVVDACPASCNKCKECSHGCAIWFIGNGVCDKECNNPNCQFDGGDCWKVDCKLSSWSHWSSCSVSCGPGGRITRTRQIIVQPRNGGETCGALTAEETGCNSHIPCPLSCNVSNWTEWSPCSTSCGIGRQMRERSIIMAPKDQNMYQCPETRQVRECMLDTCATNCTLGDFSLKSMISKNPCKKDDTCIERREIITPPFKNEDSEYTCIVEERPIKCETEQLNCPSTCKLSEWSEWSPCTHFDVESKEKISQRRIRYVIERREDDLNCKDVTEFKDCNSDLGLSVQRLLECEMSQWSSWSACSSTCGNGSRLRTRWLLSGPNNAEAEKWLNTDSICGPLFQTKFCNEMACLNERCIVSEWNEWSKCSSKICNIAGLSKRSRSIVTYPKKGNCPPLEESKDCFGSCDALSLLDDGKCNLGEWSTWSSCEDECRTVLDSHLDTKNILEPNKVYRHRHRTIIYNPNNLNCELYNNYMERIECSDECNIQDLDDCKVSSWGSWSECSASCGGGSRRRLRKIINKTGNIKGVKQSLPATRLNCPALLAIEKCNTYPCTERCIFGSWSEPSECSSKCGFGITKITRKVISHSHFGDSQKALSTVCGVLEDSSKCFSMSTDCKSNCEVGEWSNWTECSVTCGEGFQSRQRKLIIPSINRKCNFSTEDFRPCSMASCSNECVVSSWSEWSSCLGICGMKPKRIRERLILELPITPKKCPHLIETKEDDKECPEFIECPQDCEVSEWSEWSACGINCGIGVQNRVREILKYNSDNGLPCPSLQDYRPCAERACKMDCTLSEWNEWSTCSKTCGSGSKSRTRTILNKPNDGLQCGHLREFQSCNEFQCIATRDCEVGQWSAWSPCTATCGGGIKRRQRVIQVAATGGGRCEFDLTQKVGCNGFRCPDEACIDRPEAQEVVPCAILKAMFGCQKRLVDVAKANGVPYPDDKPTEARIMDGCPATCGMCLECAPNCQLRDIGNLHCDIACNNANCRYDDGDCENNETRNPRSTCILPKAPEGVVYKLILAGATKEISNTIEPSISNSAIEISGTAQYSVTSLNNKDNLFSVPDSLTSSTLLQPEYKRGDVVIVQCNPGYRFRRYSAIPFFKYQCNESGFVQQMEPSGVPLLYVDGDGIPRIPSCEEDQCPFIIIKNAPQVLNSVNTVYKRDSKHAYTYIMFRDIGEPIYITGDHHRLIIGPVGTLYLISIEPFYPENNDPQTEKYTLWSLVDISIQKVLQEFVEIHPICSKDTLERQLKEQEFQPKRLLKSLAYDLRFENIPNSRITYTNRNRLDFLNFTDTLKLLKTSEIPNIIDLKNSQGLIDINNTYNLQNTSNYIELQGNMSKKVPEVERKNKNKLRFLQQVYNQFEVNEDSNIFLTNTNLSSSEIKRILQTKPSTQVLGKTRYCEDQPEVAENGISCSSLVSMCDFAIPSPETYGLPPNSYVWQICPETCKKCEECSPGCPKWFVANSVCDKACNNSECNFDGGDCTEAKDEKQIEEEFSTHEPEQSSSNVNFSHTDSTDSTDSSLIDNSPVLEGPITYFAGKFRNCMDIPELMDSRAKCKALKQACLLRLPLTPSSKEAGLPTTATIKQICPMTCGICEECAPGCPKWFLGNNYCDLSCNNSQCHFDEGDCDDGNLQNMVPSSHSSSIIIPELFLPSKMNIDSLCIDHPAIPLMFKTTCKDIKSRYGCNVTLDKIKPNVITPKDLTPKSTVRQACEYTCNACSTSLIPNKPSSTIAPLKPFTIVMGKKRYCEDQPEVAEKGYNCVDLAAMCNIPIPNAKSYGLPEGSHLWRVCPYTCQKCEECSPGCLLWFIGNTVCDQACNNSNCDFDGGDCAHLLDNGNMERDENKINTTNSLLHTVPPEISTKNEDLKDEKFSNNEKQTDTEIVPPNFSTLDTNVYPCQDDPRVEEASGFTCRQILGVFDCNTPLKDLPGSQLPPDIPQNTLLLHACAESCGLCNTDNTSIDGNTKLSNSPICKDDVLYDIIENKCRDIINYAVYIGQVCNESLENRAIFKNPKLVSQYSSKKIYDHCPKSCGRCREECNDDPKIQPGECRIAIETANILGYGCDIPLLQVSVSLAERFNNKENLRLSDICARSCNYCSNYGVSYLSKPNRSFCSFHSTKQWGPGYYMEFTEKKGNLNSFKSIDDQSSTNLIVSNDETSKMQSNLLVSCATGFTTPSLPSSTVEAVCDLEKNIYVLPEQFKCEEPHVQVMQVILQLERAADLDYKSVSSIYTALYSSLPIYQHNGLRLEAISTRTFDRDPIDHIPIECTDQNNQLESFGISCSMLKPFCSKTLAELAKQFNREVPADVSTDIEVSVACPITCDSCDKFKEAVNKLKNQDNEEVEDVAEISDTRDSKSGLKNSNIKDNIQNKDDYSSIGPLYIMFAVGFFSSSSAGREASFKKALKDPSVSQRFITSLRTQFASRSVKLTPKTEDIDTINILNTEGTMSLADGNSKILDLLTSKNYRLAADAIDQRPIKAKFHSDRMIRMLKSRWDNLYAGPKSGPSNDMNLDEDARNLFYSSGITMPFILTATFGQKESLFLKRPLPYLQNLYLKCKLNSQPINKNGLTYFDTNREGNTAKGGKFVEHEDCCLFPIQFRRILVQGGCGSLLYDREPTGTQVDLFCRGGALQKEVNDTISMMSSSKPLISSFIGSKYSSSNSKQSFFSNLQSIETSLKEEFSTVHSTNIDDPYEIPSCYHRFHSLIKRYSMKQGTLCNTIKYAQQLIDSWCYISPKSDPDKPKDNERYCFSRIKTTINTAIDPEEFVSSQLSEIESRCDAYGCYRSHLKYFDSVTQLHYAWGYPLPPSPLKKQIELEMRNTGFGSSGPTSGHSEFGYSYPSLASLGLDVILGETNESWLDLMCTKTSDGSFCQESLSLLLEKDPIKSRTLFLNPCDSKCFIIVAGKLGTYLQRYGKTIRDPQAESLGLLLRHYSRHFCLKNEKGQTCGPLLFAGASAALEASLNFNNSNINSGRTKKEMNESNEINTTSKIQSSSKVSGFQAINNSGYCSPSCFSQYVGDGMCDSYCFNESCNWDADDCRVSSMYPEIYIPLQELFNGCIGIGAEVIGATNYNNLGDQTKYHNLTPYYPSCSSICKARHSLLTDTLGCCTAIAMDLYHSLNILDKHLPTITSSYSFITPSDHSWWWSISRLEQICSMTFDRTCSHGAPRPVYHLLLGINQPESALISNDPNAVQMVTHIVSQQLGIVESDITKVTITAEPKSYTVKQYKYIIEVVIDLGTINFIDMHPLTPSLWEHRRLEEKLTIDFCSETGDILQNISCYVKIISISTKIVTSIGVNKSIPPPLPWMNSVGFQSTNQNHFDLPMEPCSLNNPYFQDNSRYMIITTNVVNISEMRQISYPHGTKFTIKCSNNKYYASSGRSPDIIYCNNGRWDTNTNIQCNKPCKPLQNFPNGLVQKLNKYTTDGNSLISHATLINVACSSGYSSTTHIIEDVIKCFDGEWIYPKFECKKRCINLHSGSLGEGYIVAGIEYRHGDQRKVSCSNGHYLSPKSGNIGNEALKSESHSSNTSSDVEDSIKRGYFLLTCKNGDWESQPLICVKGSLTNFSHVKRGIEVTFSHIFSLTTLIGVSVIIAIIAVLVTIIFWMWKLKYKQLTDLYDFDQYERVQNARRILLQLYGLDPIQSYEQPTTETVSNNDEKCQHFSSWEGSEQ
ncbi:thrombospondin type 1 domain-containing protein [Cryptosporidium andersoni]|uniref:Thrombospondin type 1 domain-containing protein n=1 Tax=Cryptosporidium andersoni TaxID=117008 RepID=A0A1J4MWH8_9CRYT|nr:thrombospondin type 1 domain-containing protein [Cryptosporidium andersoni]